MPARGKSSGGLPAILPQRVNNFISVDKYYRSANLLVRQANEYRAQQNELQLYTMLMRFASLVVETIPDHKDFNKNSAEYRSLRQTLGTKLMPELETLKLSLRLRKGEDSSRWMQQPASHTPDTVQISVSSLPQLDWDRFGSQASQASPRQQADASYQFTGHPAPTAPSTGLDLLTGSTQGSTASQLRASSSGSLELPTFRHSMLSSEASRERHTLLPKAAPSHRAASASAVGGPLYPQFDASPFSPIDYGPSRAQQGTVIDQQLSSLDIRQPDSGAVPSLMDATVSPRPGPLLGPQEVEVLNMPQLTGPPDPSAGCSHTEAQPPPPPPPPDEQPGAISKQKEIREVHVSMRLMEEFLAYAKSNTRRAVESCGILAGVLDTKRGLFNITTLIVPKQEGTSDTVQALAEEEIFDVQDKRGLYPMGWIHTHPTQTCFLSSIDVHTQCGYQTMLDEAVAIVMAPSDRTKRCGIFRLSTPGGLKLVQKCQLRGFHAHPVTDTGQPLYELCGHVYLNERLQHDVVDLR